MRIAALVLAALCSSCAIPVRPIAFLEQDKGGRWHFVPDEAQEPKAADAIGWLAPILGAVGGPYGEGALALLTMFLGHQIGGRRAKAKAERAHKTKADPSVSTVKPA